MSELRGWLHEVYFGTGRENTFQEYDGVLDEVRKQFNALAEKYSLQVVED